MEAEEEMVEHVMHGHRHHCMEGRTLTTFLVMQLVLSYAMSKLVRFFFRRSNQPPIISDLIAGILINNLKVMHRLFPEESHKSLNSITTILLIYFMFVTGLGMDLTLFYRQPHPEYVIAHAGTLPSILAALITTLFARQSSKDQTTYLFLFSFIFSNTATSVLPCLVTELKLSRSELGKLALSSGIINDFTTLVLASLTIVCFTQHGALNLLFTFFFMVALCFILRGPVGHAISDWIDNRNPEGRPMNENDIAMCMVGVTLLIISSYVIGLNMLIMAFWVGMFVPKEGRVTRALVSKFNLFTHSMVFPIYFCHVGLHMELGVLARAHGWNILGVSVVTGAMGKIAGTFSAARLQGIQWQEGIVLGVLMNVKGHLHLIFAQTALDLDILGGEAYTLMVLTVITSIVFVPLAARFLLKQTGSMAPALPGQGLGQDLRILACMHSAHNVSATINLLEASRGTDLPPIAAYAMHIVELTEPSAASPRVGDRGQEDTEEQMAAAFTVFEETSGVTVVQLSVISPFATMHEDICKMAHDVRASLIILPFHRNQCIDGTLDQGNYGFRMVNQKVLQHAPCSVGIIVDRGLGRTNLLTHKELYAAVIFIGGPDDREALSFSDRLAGHAGIWLTVVRFLPDSGDADDAIDSFAGQNSTAVIDQEREQGLDEEHFSHFFQKHVAIGRVSYVEKLVANGAETVEALRSLEGLYSLFIVGRNGRQNTLLTAGLDELVECQELGPIGDVLASSKFSATASILILQQCCRNDEAVETIS